MFRKGTPNAQQTRFFIILGSQKVWKSEVLFQVCCSENLFAKVGDALLINTFAAFPTLDVNSMYWKDFDNEGNNKLSFKRSNIVKGKRSSQAFYIEGGS